MTPKRFLMVTKQAGEVRESVTKFESEYAISAGVMWGAIGADMVPLFEEHTARLERNYSLAAWYALDPMERALVVAARRIDIATRNQQSDAEIRQAKIDAARQGKR